VFIDRAAGYCARQQTRSGRPALLGLRLGHAISSRVLGCPLPMWGVLAAALSVSQADYVMDKLSAYAAVSV
jgi:hypothetical protein